MKDRLTDYTKQFDKWRALQGNANGSTDDYDKFLIDEKQTQINTKYQAKRAKDKSEWKKKTINKNKNDVDFDQEWNVLHSNDWANELGIVRTTSDKEKAIRHKVFVKRDCDGVAAAKLKEEKDEEESDSEID